MKEETMQVKLQTYGRRGNCLYDVEFRIQSDELGDMQGLAEYINNLAGVRTTLKWIMAVDGGICQEWEYDAHRGACDE